MAQITVKHGVKLPELFLMAFGVLVICLFCQAGYIVSQEPTQVYVNGIEIEKVMTRN